MSFLSAIGAALPVIKLLLELFIKTPEEKLLDVREALLGAMSELKDGIKHIEENAGDTSKLEEALNRARRKSK